MGHGHPNPIWPCWQDHPWGSGHPWGSRAPRGCKDAVIPFPIQAAAGEGALLSRTISKGLSKEAQPRLPLWQAFSSVPITFRRAGCLNSSEVSQLLGCEVSP